MARAKVSIIGAGRVGSTTAQILAYKELCDIVLWNRTAETAEGIALDLNESAPIFGFDVNIEGTGDFSSISGSEIVAVTVGAQRKEGMSREDLLATNSGILRGVCEQVKRYAPESKLVVITNPLDSMVLLAKSVTGFPKQRVMGMAGILDSSRFREFIAKELGASVSDISALVLGGHGDFMVPLPRYTTVGGTPVDELLSKEKLAKIVERTRNAGAEIIKLEKESSAFYAPAASLALMIEAMLKDKKMTLPCAAYLEGEYGIRDIFMGVPVVLGANGIEKVVELKLKDDEKALVKLSAEKIMGSVRGLKLN
ncbi:MAG: malate dehydrogenase [Candidatus Micrarchaeales archaeon]|nr:malate dehydrogenase [Candidatus Micrarchaeales archaeon]